MGSEQQTLERTAHHGRTMVLSMRPVWSTEMILYFGDWEVERDESDGLDWVGNLEGRSHRSNTQFSAFEFSFRGSTVRWLGTRGPDHGFADVYLDGLFQETVDNYAQTRQEDLVKFEKTGIEGDRVHTLRVVVRKDRNPRATDCYQDVTATEAEQPVSYPAEISHAMQDEYAQMRTGTKPYLPPEEWSPVPNGADAPERGVTLGSGLLKDILERNVDYLNHSFASPTYCDGVGWSEWLPASIEGRLLAGAGNTLRWGEREDMRKIVDTIIDDIEERMRGDGFYNYYQEEDSYALNYGRNSERKNYDRVFWTRGMIAAGMVGNEKAYGLLRRMYDWFNASPYLPDILFGGNATNGMPGGPLTYLSPVGVDQDLITTLRYYDQDYWMRELTKRQPLCMSYYPGERPHCYDLLGFEMFVDEYRATGDQKYLDAVLGGWDVYRDNFKHIGGATAIMESHKIYPPKSYYFTNHNMGETCGSVFWIYVNSKLLQLFPTEERFASETEEAIYNIIAAAQDHRGYIRYHNVPHNHKVDSRGTGTCCEVATTGLIGRLPEYIYSVAEDGVYLNLYASSEISLENGVRLTMTADFPAGTAVSVRISAPNPTPMNLRVRVPSWATGPMVITINGEEVASGTPGSYQALERNWVDGDTVAFTLPIGLKAVQYQGLEQLEGNLDRYALLYGPVLLALQGELDGPLGVPHLEVDPEELPSLLTPVPGDPFAYEVAGHPDHRYVHYWKIDEETFTCLPAVQP